jgi:hypothetical protein
MDVAQWMCNALDMPGRILLICDELYAQKADGDMVASARKLGSFKATCYNRRRLIRINSYPL